MVALNLWLISSFAQCALSASIAYDRNIKRNCIDGQIIIIGGIVRACTRTNGWMGSLALGAAEKFFGCFFFVVMKNKRNICQRTITRYRVVVADSRVHQNDSVEFMIRLFMIGSGDGDGDNMRAQIYWYCTRHSENRWTERRTCRPVCGAHRDIANHHDDCFRRQQFCFVFSRCRRRYSITMNEGKKKKKKL